MGLFGKRAEEARNEETAAVKSERLVRQASLVAAALAVALLLPAHSADGRTAREALPPGVAAMAASGEIVPAELPGDRPVPVTLRIGFTSEGLADPSVPELSRIAFDITRSVSFQTGGLPSCSLAELSETYESPGRVCAGSLVGQGSVASEVTLAGQAPVRVEGGLLAFYSDSGGTPRILAQVTTGEPLPLTYVIPFEVKAGGGAFGTRLVARGMSNIRGKCARDHPNCFAQPYALKGVYGQIADLELSLNRRFTRGGSRRGFVSASCPAGDGPSIASFPLVRAELSYADSAGRSLSEVVTGSCRASNPPRG